MNKNTILSDLREAKEELDSLIAEIENDDEFDFDNYYVSMQHIYHHLNTAWNIRKESEETIKEYTEDNFRRWSQFPKDEYDMGT
jgi:hypothetical protein